MAGIGFKDINIARRLKQIAENPPGFVGDRGLEYSEAFFAKSPEDGIPAISGTTLGKAECDCYTLSYDSATGDADLKLMTDADGITITVMVHNYAPSKVGNNKLLIVAYMYGVYIPIVELCD